MLQDRFWPNRQRVLCCEMRDNSRQLSHPRPRVAELDCCHVPVDAGSATVVPDPGGGGRYCSSRCMYSQDRPQMRLAENQDVIKAFLADGSIMIPHSDRAFFFIWRRLASSLGSFRINKRSYSG